MVEGLPSQYIFQLLPCYKDVCIHPVCRKGKPDKEPVWYAGGPPLLYLPIPVPDPKHYWGQPCDRCKGLCTGHYLNPNDHAEFVARNGTEKCVFVPPKDQLESAAKLKFEKNEEWTQAD